MNFQMKCACEKGLSVKDRGLRSRQVEAITGILCILWLVIPALAMADGMAFTFRHGPASSLEPLGVDEQRAIIAHKDGMQRMFIAINLQDPPSAEDSSRAAVWIFPVPGSPDKSDVDVTSFIPELRGYDVQQTFEMAMDALRFVPIATQPHFFPFAFGHGRVSFSLKRMGKGMPEEAGTSGVTTHKEIDKWGIHAEIITADSVDRLADYLHRKKVGVGEETLTPFAPYLSDKYVLVVAWISSYEEFISRFPQYKEKRGGKRPALYVEFPTDKPFYPMRPTSGYGKKEMTVSLYLVGWLNLDMSSWAPSEKAAMHPSIRYYAGWRKAFDAQHGTFLRSQEKEAEMRSEEGSTARLRRTADKFFSAIPTGDVPFTRALIRTEAANFTQDFRFSPNSRVSIMHFLVTSLWAPVLAVMLLLVIPSYLSGGISGKLVFGQWKPWARTGLWNCLTVIALVIAVWRKRRRSTHESTRASVSGRWNAFVLGILMSVPILTLVRFISIHFHHSPMEAGLGLSVLLSGLLVAEILIASWIVTQSGPVPPAGKEPGPVGKRLLISVGKRESLIRVFLMCAPTTISGPLLFLEAFPLLRVGTLRLNVGEPLWLNSLALAAILVLITTIVSILLSVLINVALMIGARIAGKTGSTRSARKDPQSQGEASGFFGHRSAALVLGVLTCIPVVFLVPIGFLDVHWSSASAFPFAACGFIIFEMLIATWIVWKGTSAPVSMEARLSPGWHVAISVLPLLLLVLWLVIGFIAVYIYGYYALTVIGPVVIVGFLTRKRLLRAIRAMSYKTALSTIILIMGALFYLAVLVEMVADPFSPWSLNSYWPVVGLCLSILALLLGTWLVKGLLSGGPTKALRFGVVFSVVFGLLNLAIFLAMAWLGSSGV